MALLPCAAAKQSTFCNAKQCTFCNAKQYQIKMHCKRCTWLILIISNVLLLVLQKISLCQTINQYMHRPTGSCYCLILCLQACPTARATNDQNWPWHRNVFLSQSPTLKGPGAYTRFHRRLCDGRNIWGTASHYCNCQVHLWLSCTIDSLPALYCF